MFLHSEISVKKKVFGDQLNGWGGSSKKQKSKKKNAPCFLIFLIWTTTGNRGNLRGPRRPKKYKKSKKEKEEKGKGKEKNEKEETKKARVRSVPIGSDKHTHRHAHRVSASSCKGIGEQEFALSYLKAPVGWIAQQHSALLC